MDQVSFERPARGVRVQLWADGALVAERHEAVGAFVDTHRGDTALDPTVAGIISAAGTVSATGLLADRVRLTELTSHAMAGLHGCHALRIPVQPISSSTPKSPSANHIPS